MHKLSTTKHILLPKKKRVMFFFHLENRFSHLAFYDNEKYEFSQRCKTDTKQTNTKQFVDFVQTQFPKHIPICYFNIMPSHKAQMWLWLGKVSVLITFISVWIFFFTLTNPMLFDSVLFMAHLICGVACKMCGDNLSNWATASLNNIISACADAGE